VARKGTEKFVGKRKVISLLTLGEKVLNFSPTKEQHLEDQEPKERMGGGNQGVVKSYF